MKAITTAQAAQAAHFSGPTKLRNPFDPPPSRSRGGRFRLATSHAHSHRHAASHHVDPPRYATSHFHSLHHAARHKSVLLLPVSGLPLAVAPLPKTRSSLAATARPLAAHVDAPRPNAHRPTVQPHRVDDCHVMHLLHRLIVNPQSLPMNANG